MADMSVKRRPMRMRIVTMRARVSWMRMLQK